jgi:hypothetical protein
MDKSETSKKLYSLIYSDRINNNIKPKKSLINRKILTNEIFKVLKLRLFFENSKLSDESIYCIISKNLNKIDIRYFDPRNISLFVDDLLKYIKDNIPINFSKTVYAQSNIDKIYDDVTPISIRQIQPKTQREPMHFNNNKIKKDSIPFFLDDNESYINEINSYQKDLIAKVMNNQKIL